MNQERAQQRQAERDRIADSLVADYAADLPKSVSDRVFALAWEYGHSAGEGEIEVHFIEFADLAGDAFRAGRGC